jgi:hypothetical protein
VRRFAAPTSAVVVVGACSRRTRSPMSVARPRANRASTSAQLCGPRRVPATNVDVHRTSIGPPSSVDPPERVTADNRDLLGGFAADGRRFVVDSSSFDSLSFDSSSLGSSFRGTVIAVRVRPVFGRDVQPADNARRKRVQSRLRSCGAVCATRSVRCPETLVQQVPRLRTR